MSKNIPDEKFDLLLKGLLDRSVADDSVVDDIADSPALWWNVQRRIEEQKDASRTPWPPVRTFFRVLKYGVPAFAAIALMIGIVFLYPWSDEHNTAELQQMTATKPVGSPDKVETAIAVQPEPINEIKTITHHKFVRAKAIRKASSLRSNVADPTLVAKKTEIKSDFIALSYARDAESGQIVRVKVPSSMMVTLGLVATVEKPSALVDAEVIVGDDGLTRAIRFIH